MKVAFIGKGTTPIDIINDKIVSDNGTPVNNVPAYQYAAQQMGWGIDEDMDGNKCLTLEKPVGIPYYIDVDKNGTTYTYPNVEFIGGRPPVIRK